MRRNPSNCTMDDVNWLLIKLAGCAARQSGTSHRIFRHPIKRVYEFPDGVNVPYNRPIKANYIRNAISYYDALTRGEE